MSVTYNNEFDMLVSTVANKKHDLQFHKVIPNADVKNFTFNR